MKGFRQICFIVLFSLLAAIANAQQPADLNNITYDRNGRPIKRNTDSAGFTHRNDAADSLTIYYKYYNQFKPQLLDSSINDFYTRFPLPYYYNHLGNLGTAARSLLFNPNLTNGFNAGFHQFDIYNYTLQNTRLFSTTKPYTELTYLLGSGSEQTINILHTQNKKDNVNFSLEYRFINAPGVLRNQNASVNNLRFTLQYQSPSKRYHFLAVLFSNKNASSENGGTVNYKTLDSLSLNNPFELPTRLGINTNIYRNLFSTTVNTGNTYKQNQITFINQYDFGTKDSIVTDTSNYKLYYSRFRLQHLLSIKGNEFQFKDIYADSTNYNKYFGLNIKGNPSGYDTVLYKDKWNILANEISIYSYPDKKNSQQYIKASAAYESIIGRFADTLKQKLHNSLLGFEYRNRTRNKVWDIEANAHLYLSGFNAGDYNVSMSLQKILSRRAGSLQVGFLNYNQSPAFIYNNAASNFYVVNRGGFTKENITKLWLTYHNKAINFSLHANYFLLSNFLYFDNFFNANQQATLFNVLHIGIEKKFKLSRYINLYSEVHMQQVTDNAPINIPQILTRQRIAFEGNFYKNLFMSTGFEFRYHSKYKPVGYSPIIGQFFYQNQYSLYNRPDINFYFNFRIKSFKAFLRAENLNSLMPPSGYKKYNYSLEQYPMQAVHIRFGVWWSFVN